MERLVHVLFYSEQECNPQMSCPILMKFQYLLYFIFPAFGIACLTYYNVYDHGNKLMLAIGVIAIVYVIFIKLAPYIIILDWALWFHMSVLLLMMSLVLVKINTNASDITLMMGILGAVVVTARPCFGFEVFVKRRTTSHERRPTQQEGN